MEQFSSCRVYGVASKRHYKIWCTRVDSPVPASSFFGLVCHHITNPPRLRWKIVAHIFRPLSVSLLDVPELQRSIGFQAPYYSHHWLISRLLRRWITLQLTFAEGQIIKGGICSWGWFKSRRRKFSFFFFFSLLPNKWCFISRSLRNGSLQVFRIVRRSIEMISHDRSPSELGRRFSS